MNKTKKRSFRSFRYIHCDDFSDYLESMARQGWHFLRWPLWLEFEKGEPSDTCYHVEVFDRATEWDTHPEGNTEDYSDYCAAAGWKLVDSRRKFCIFQRLRSDAPPIVTEEERFHSIRRASLISWFLLMAVVLLLLLNLFLKISQGSLGTLFFHNMGLVLIFAIILILAKAAAEGLLLAFWFRKKAGLLAAGSPCSYRAENYFMKLTQRFRWLCFPCIYLFYVSVSLLDRQYRMAVYLAVFLLADFLLEMLLYYRRPDRLAHIKGRIAIAFFLSVLLVMATPSAEETRAKERIPAPFDAPLYLEDLKEVSAPDSFLIHRTSKSLAGRMEYYSLSYGIRDSGENTLNEDFHTEDSLWYYIYESPHPWILEQLLKEKTRELFSLSAECAAKWKVPGAVSGSYYAYYCYVLPFPGRLTCLYSLHPIDSPMQRGIILEKLCHTTL